MEGALRSDFVLGTTGFSEERIAQGDFTLRGLVAELGDRGFVVDYRTVLAFVRRDGLSCKPGDPTDGCVDALIPAAVWRKSLTRRLF
jgi:transposase